MKKVLSKYEAKHLKNLATAQARIKEIMRETDVEVSVYARSLIGGGKGVTKKAPVKARLDNIQTKLNLKLKTVFQQSTNTSQIISDGKNREIITTVIKNKKAQSIIITKEFGTGNQAAVDIFKKRSKEGFNLSDRVWKLTKQKRFEMDKSIEAAISDGKSAKDLSETIQKYLREPNKLFRRVRDESGNLVASQASKEYKPGAGVYKSSEANATRLARNEINYCLRSADHERWNSMPIVRGIVVVLSNRHKEYDICDSLKGEYPKEFKFTGWHVNCLCHAEPILITEKQLSQYEDYLLGITNKPPAFSNISSPPPGFTTWTTTNKKRIKGWASKPYWIADNKNFLPK